MSSSNNLYFFPVPEEYIKKLGVPSNESTSKVDQSKGRDKSNTNAKSKNKSKANTSKDSDNGHVCLVPDNSDRQSEVKGPKERERREYIKPTPQLVDQAKGLLAKGESKNEVSKKTGLSLYYVNKIYKGENVIIDPEQLRAKRIELGRQLAANNKAKRSGNNNSG
jgi:hypothetical protein